MLDKFKLRANALRSLFTFKRNWLIGLCLSTIVWGPATDYLRSKGDLSLLFDNIWEAVINVAHNPLAQIVYAVAVVYAFYLGCEMIIEKDAKAAQQAIAHRDDESARLKAQLQQAHEQLIEAARVEHNNQLIILKNIAADVSRSLRVPLDLFAAFDKRDRLEKAIRLRQQLDEEFYKYQDLVTERETQEEYWPPIGPSVPDLVASSAMNLHNLLCGISRLTGVSVPQIDTTIYWHLEQAPSREVASQKFSQFIFHRGKNSEYLDRHAGNLEKIKQALPALDTSLKDRKTAAETAIEQLLQSIRHSD